MLSDADAILVQRDRGIPALALLLDGDAVARELAAIFQGAIVRSAVARYVRYKPGTSCLVAYRVETGEGVVDAYIRAIAPAQPGKLEKRLQRTVVPSALGRGMVLLEDRGLAVHVYPNDHELRGLVALGDPARRRDLLAATLPALPDLHDAPIAVLSYKPERRCVVRVGPAEPGAAVLRFYGREDYRMRAKRHVPIEARGPLRVPARLGHAGPFIVSAHAWANGRTLDDDVVAPEDMARIGTALAALHGQAGEGCPEAMDCTTLAAALEGSADTIAEIAPDLESRARRLAGHIGRRLLDLPPMAAAIHGDCSADQVVLGDDTVTLIDLDHAGRGDPRIDLGTFRARLICAGRDRLLDLHAADGAFAPLLEAYERDAGAVDAAALDVFTAASLLRFGVEPFRHRAKRWPEATESILAGAEALLGSGARVSAVPRARG